MAEQKLLLTYYKNAEAAFLLEKDKLIQIMLGPTDYTCAIGNVYVGRVKNIVPGISAAFVEFAKDKIGFLSLKDIKTKNILNRSDAQSLKCGDEILVQISKEPIKTKEATLTTDISFSGKYLVLIPFSRGIHYSKKFTPQQKDTIREAITKIIGHLFVDPELFLNKYGLIVRTNAAQADLYDIGKELHDLLHKAGDVVANADKRTVFSCLYKEDSFYERTIKKFYYSGKTEIVTDDAAIYSHLQETEDAEILSALSLYEDESLSLMSLYGLKAQIEEALAKRVWLKCGGYLVIEPTEALTVIDVNSGKSSTAQNKLSPEAFYTKVNMEAASEIARQLRLRNISGIVIVDFLKLKEQENIEALLTHVRELLRRDCVETFFCDMTGLGLVEITRQKTEAPLYEKISQLENISQVK